MATAPVRARIKEKCAELENVSKQLLRPVPFPRTPDEPAVNRNISDVFAQAAEILRSVSKTEECEDASAQLEAVLKDEVSELDAQFEARTKQFSQALTDAHKIFGDKIEEIRSDYRNRLRRLSDDHAAAEEMLEQEYADTCTTFADRLYEATNHHVREREMLQEQLSKFINQCQEFLVSLPPRMEAVKARGAVLTEEKARLQACEDAETCNRIESLERENKKVSEEIDAAKETFKKDMDSITSELDKFSRPQNERLEEALKQLLEDAESTKEWRHQMVEDVKKDMKRRHGMEWQAKVQEIEGWKKDIQQKKQALAEANKKHEMALQKLNEKTEAVLENKQQEIDVLKKTHANAMKQLQQRLQQEMEKEVSSATETKRRLEMELGQKQKEMTAVLSKEISGLAKTQPAEKQLIIKPVPASPARKPPVIREPKSPTGRTSPRRLRATPQSPDNWKADIDNELNVRLKKFSEAGKMELTSVSRSLESVERQFKAEQLRLQLRLDDITRQKKYFFEEKQRMQTRLKQLEEAQTLLNKEAHTTVKEREDALQATIAQQHAIIARIKEILQRDPRKVGLSDIKKEFQNELRQLQQEVSALEAANQDKLDEFRQYYQQHMDAEKRETDRIIGQFNGEYEATMAEIRRTEDLKAELLRNHQIWMATRKEMADSNNRILGVLQSRDGPRSESPIRAVTLKR